MSKSHLQTENRLDQIDSQVRTSRTAGTAKLSTAHAWETSAQRANVDSTSEGGRPLPAALQVKMGRSLGFDFSAIRIFPNSPAATDACALALTRGSAIHFAPGHYAPEAEQGQAIIGHELAHAAQQRLGLVRSTKKQGGLTVSDDAALERDATLMGTRAARGGSAGMRAPAELRRLPAARGHVVQAAPNPALAERRERFRRKQRDTMAETFAFDSTGVSLEIRRPSQSLQISTHIPYYGMECNAVEFLYTLQSYGLIPKNMTLEEFQEAFTSIDSKKQWQRNPSHVR